MDINTNSPEIAANLSFGYIRKRVNEVYAQLQEEELTKMRRYEEEKPSIEKMIGSLDQSLEMLKKERRKVAADLLSVQQQQTKSKSADMLNSFFGGNTDTKSSGIGFFSSSASKQNAFEKQRGMLEGLRKKLDNLNERLLALESDLKLMKYEIRDISIAVMKAEESKPPKKSLINRYQEEQEILTTKLVVMQDTRRLLIDEIEVVKEDILRKDMQQKVEAEYAAAEASGRVRLVQLDEQINRLTTKMDDMKMNLYFPDSKGYRFSSGANGIYVGVRDIHVSEISGRFELQVTPLPPLSMGASGTNPLDLFGVAAAYRRRRARMTVRLGGVSSAKDWTEIKTNKAAAAQQVAEERHEKQRREHQRQREEDLMRRFKVERPDSTSTDPSPMSSSIPSTPSSASNVAPPPFPPQTLYHQNSGGGAGGDSGGVPSTASTPRTGTTPITPDGFEVNKSLAAACNAEMIGPGKFPSTAGGMGENSNKDGNAALSAVPSGVVATHQQQSQQREQQQYQQQQQQAYFPPAPKVKKVKGEVVSNILSSLSMKNKKDRDKAALCAAIEAAGGEIPPYLANEFERSGRPLYDDASVGGREKEGGEGRGLSDLKFLPKRSSNSGSGEGGRSSGIAKFKSKLKDGFTDTFHEKTESLSKFAKSIAKKAAIQGREINEGVQAFKHIIKGEEEGGGAGGRGSRPLGEGIESGGVDGEDDDEDVSEGVSVGGDGLSPHGRQGVYLYILGERLGLVGEKGTKVPDLQVKEFRLEAEIQMHVTLDYDPILRQWQASEQYPATFSVLQLRHKLRGGGTGMLPKALIKTLLTAYMPGVLTRALLDATPPELGQYVAESGEPISLSGEIRLAGPGIEALGASLTPLPSHVVAAAEAAETAGIAKGDKKAHGCHAAVLHAAQARQLLGNLSVAQAAALADLCLGGRFNLSPDPLATASTAALAASAAAAARGIALTPQQMMNTQAMYNNAVTNLGWSCLGQGVAPTILGLCCLHVSFSKSPKWPQLCALWEQALQLSYAAHNIPLADRVPFARIVDSAHAAAAADLAAAAGYPPPNGLADVLSPVFQRAIIVGLPASSLPPPPPIPLFKTSTFPVHAMAAKAANNSSSAAASSSSSSSIPLSTPILPWTMPTGAVQRITRKPLRVAFSVEKLSLAVDADIALSALRSWFERVAREFHKRAQTEGLATAREPLEDQLDALGLWSGELSREIRKFKSKFRRAGACLLVAADHEDFQFGVESSTYDGPLSVKVPVDVAMDNGDRSFIWDVRLPDREEAASSMTSYVTEIFNSLSVTVAPPPSTTSKFEKANAPPLPSPSLISTPLKTSPSKYAVPGSPPRPLMAALKGSASEPEAASPNKRGGGEDEGEGSVRKSGAQGNGAVEGEAAHILVDPLVGRLSLRRVGLSLVLDDRRLKSLLKGLMASSAALIGSGGGTGNTGTGNKKSKSKSSLAAELLACHGDLFSASLDVGWVPKKPIARVDGSPSPRRKNGESPSKAMESCCMLTVANSEITRVKAEVESFWFQSCVAPKLAIRVLQTVVLSLIRKFGDGGESASSTYSQIFWCKIFDHIHEYVSKGSLDMMVCLGLHAESVVITDPLRLALTRESRRNYLTAKRGSGSGVVKGTQGGANYSSTNTPLSTTTSLHNPQPFGMASAAAVQAATLKVAATEGYGFGGESGSGGGLNDYDSEDDEWVNGEEDEEEETRLRIVFAGNPHDNPPGLRHVCPIYLLNDFNLTTILESARLISDAYYPTPSTATA
mmetsp:Transcript_20153/g.36210  ORF Transcript_20153/g.36210 Transcript_20153/m.36210 type:complete len:1754 (-) Transcript_20153:729-5990(-)|eukprot:CAMPEP_0175040120 /NCGR_PEP_ID=MMETSP0052_2-20121109/1058_1 /TAXON_ID=51329 ORGANISM="Polytomella parva, Strain SAG 63-3" /NCGR_SAMPLE_ID=MMETSP0052_2 /ASSEMBLY_ACC=CAM_ASM_000194 /LENGTH=1753 /DNA_ID=CAMNT_0016302239 /DNA_START=141 /DNA_END=5402 /DNA_ORIENTATION=+